MVVEVKVDATKALARFSPAGIPAQVRNNLRMAIPPLMRELTAQIDTNLSVLKSRTHLQIVGGRQGQMIENASQIVGKAEMGWTGDPKASMVPSVIESGARPHVIRAVNAQSLGILLGTNRRNGILQAGRCIRAFPAFTIWKMLSNRCSRVLSAN